MKTTDTDLNHRAIVILLIVNVSKIIITVTTDLSKQLVGAFGPGAQVQAEGTAGAVALVFTAQRQMGLGSKYREFHNVSNVLWLQRKDSAALLC